MMANGHTLKALVPTMYGVLGSVLILAAILTLPIEHVNAQTLVQDTVETMRAQVLEVIVHEEAEIVGTDVTGVQQTIRVLILSGSERGLERVIENDYLSLTVGEVFYLSHITSGIDGSEYYAVSDRDRLPALAVLVGAFIAIVCIFGGIQGIRGLLALFGSLFFIVFLLLPGVLSGYPPILVSVVVSSVIIIGASYITHGFNRMTSVAVVGMILTVCITGVIAYVAIPFAKLSGFSSEDIFYLDMNTQGVLNIAGLLIGSIIIGTLGVLYDAAIGQSVAVEELASAGPNLTKREVYTRAIRMGREHIGALVNTLAIAYTGAALPLLLLFYGFSNSSILMNINRELFATEIVRTVVGSIGIILAVPITTLIAVRTFVGRPSDSSRTHGHAHSHGHRH
jgi:uncharacterized membrane protein